MLRPEDNQLLTQTNKGTPMGELFRQYWIPALVVDEIPHPDCPPVRLKLLGERLVAYRNSDGEPVIVEEFCPHRNASLYFGRVEENGIRCVFHGWKFDKHGKCVDLPSEPNPSRSFQESICIKSYPTKEYAGIIWTYMGDPDSIPEFPEFEFGNYPDSHRIVTKWIQQCNYVQGIEANLDSSHVSFLHYGAFAKALSADKDLNRRLTTSRNPRFETYNTDYGLLIGAGRDMEDGQTYWRVTHFIMPCLTLIPRTRDSVAHAQAWVPMDDLNCYSFAISWHSDRPLKDNEIRSIRNGEQIHAKLIPGTLIPVANKSNDYLINRELQATGVSYTGIPGVAAQDAAVIESTDGIPDRTRERLGVSDTAIIQMRKLLMDSAKKLKAGQEIIRLESKRINQLRSFDGFLAKGEKMAEGFDFVKV